VITAGHPTSPKGMTPAGPKNASGLSVLMREGQRTCRPTNGALGI